MKIAIAHISDIHFKKKSDTGFKRLQKLINTISYYRSPEERMVVAVTGDVAFSGSEAEYAVAADFFQQLLSGISGNPPANEDSIIFIPGNHDCDFRNEGDLRPTLLDQVQNQMDTLDASGQIVRSILQVQDSFFAFDEVLTKVPVPLKDRLFYTRTIEEDGRSLEFRCFNSAWLSRNPEDPGRLGFPAQTVSLAEEKTDATVVVSLVHHPYNWLNPHNYQSFRRAIQQSSDFLLTGHEHVSGGEVVTSFAGSQLIHVESGPFQPSDSGESEFAIIHINLEKRLWRKQAFRWLNGHYIESSNIDWVEIAGKEERSSSLGMTAPYLAHLSAPGTGFLHPRQQHLTLEDIYVYPDMKTRSLSRRIHDSDDLPRHIPSIDVPTRLLSVERLVIAGAADSGKTALSKMLFLEANTKQGRSCLHVCGRDINGTDPEKALEDAINNSISECYGASKRDRYAELSRGARVLFIDDWDETPFNRNGRALILEAAASKFGSVVLLVDDIFLIEELSGRHECKPLADFQVVDIRDFGYRLRGQIVRKWHSLGNTFLEDEQVIARNVADSTRVIDTVLGRNLLPSYPVNILALLQTYDAAAGSQNSGLGSYGQVYEALITARLAKVSIKSIDIGTKITFLSRLAWLLFDRKQRTIGPSKWKELCQEYLRIYAIRVDPDALLKSLIVAGLLVEDEAEYRFSYGYTYCYFVAKYFQENLADLNESNGRGELFARLKLLSESVYKQDNASIIIFYVFLTKDRSLIDFVLANAREIFKEFVEFDFDTHLGFLNKIAKPLTSLNLPATNPSVNRQAYDERRDEAGEQIEPYVDPSVSDVIYGPSLTFEQKLIIGIRYLTLMGQILRNFPGSLKADTKLELAFESYSLGLRVLAAVFTLAEQDSESLVKDISHLLRTKMAFSGDDKELRDRAELIIAEMLREVAFGLLKRVSHSIGLKELEETYDEVALLRDYSLSCRLIQLSIRLDHFEQFPKKDIQDLSEELGKNVFTYQTLRDLVMNYLYLFPTAAGIQQWSGQLLGFKVNTPEVIGSARKRLKA